MRTIMRGVCLALLCLWSPALAEAEPFSFLPDGSLVFNTVFSTQGTLSCRGPIACTGTGTNTLTYESAGSHATISFTGVNQSLQVGNHAIPVLLGTFQTAIPDGFIFPERLSRAQSILQFNFSIEHTSPLADVSGKTMTAGPGGTPDLRVFPVAGTGFSFSVPTGPNPPGFNYPLLVYSINFPVLLAGTGTSNLTARVGAVPEPTSMLLLGSGIAALGWSRRRRDQVSAR
jgi:PEP-CTERM motif